MNTSTAIARVCAAHGDLRVACSITNRTGTKSFAIGVFIGRLVEVENNLRTSTYRPIERELAARIHEIRDAATRLYIEGAL